MNSVAVVNVLLQAFELLFVSLGFRDVFVSETDVALKASSSSSDTVVCFTMIHRAMCFDIAS